MIVALMKKVQSRGHPLSFGLYGNFVNFCFISLISHFDKMPRVTSALVEPAAFISTITDFFRSDKHEKSLLKSQRHLT